MSIMSWTGSVLVLLFANLWLVSSARRSGWRGWPWLLLPLLVAPAVQFIGALLVPVIVDVGVAGGDLRLAWLWPFRSVIRGEMTIGVATGHLLRLSAAFSVLLMAVGLRGFFRLQAVSGPRSDPPSRETWRSSSQI